MSSDELFHCRSCARNGRTAFSAQGLSPVKVGASSGAGAAAVLDTPAHWEGRSATRVVEAGMDQILERSRRIVEAAFTLMEQDGLDGVTIRTVLKKSGLSRRAFYERFEGKDDLMLAVFEHTIRLAARHYREQIAHLAQPLERLELIVTSIALGRGTDPRAQGPAGGRRGAAMSREHMRLAQSRPDDLQAALRPLLDLIAQQLAEGMSAGSIRRADPRRLATLVYNLVSTTTHTELLAQEGALPDPARTAPLARDVWEFCLRAIIA
jgi:AcrR family transcriptional regulator